MTFSTILSRQLCTSHGEPDRFEAGSARALDALDGDAIADLSDDCIKEMTSGELVGVVSASRDLLPAMSSPERLRMQDRRCLIRLAFLARRSHRNHHRDSSAASANGAPRAAHCRLLALGLSRLRRDSRRVAPR
jgi:hypothetical protein